MCKQARDKAWLSTLDALFKIAKAFANACVNRPKVECHLNSKS